LSLAVGIPGAGHHRVGGDHQAESAARARRWTGYLAAGLGIDAARIDLVIAPYGHRLHDGVPVPHRGSPEDMLTNLSPAVVELITPWLVALDLPEVTRHGRLAVPLHHAVARVARRFRLDGPLTKLFVAILFTDAELYFRPGDHGRRDAARDEVITALAHHRPRIVIAHSFGAVPAFEALHARPDLEVDCLITLGAPLAVPGAVFDRLRPAPVDGVGARPPGVRRWVNIADIGDPFTVLRPARTYFPGIDLDVHDNVGLFDFHRARRYLRCPAVADTLRPLVTGRP
jgi:hypothetical protein